MAWSVYAIPPGRGRRSWRLQARPAGGGRSAWKRAKTADEDTARARAAEWQAVLNAELAQVTLEPDPTVGAVIARRVEEGFPRDGTARSYRTALRRLARVGLDSVRASALTRARVFLAQDELAALPLGPGSVNLTLSCARSAWTWAHERELVPEPWPAVKKLRSPRTTKRPLRDEEVVAVLAWLRANRTAWLPLFACLADAGCRPGELVACLGADLDRDACALTLRHTKTHEVRTVALTAETVALIPRVHPEDPLFRGQRGKTDTMGVYYRLRVALRALGLDQEAVDVTSFRRAWVASAHRAGIPMDVARRQTGHRSAGIHAGYMQNAQGDDLHAAVEAVAERRRTAERAAATAERKPRGKAAEGQSDAVSGSRRSRSAACGAKACAQNGRRPRGWLGAAGVVVRLAEVLPRDPWSGELAALCAQAPEAMSALVSSAARVLAVREALEEQGYASSSLPASRSSSRTRAGG